MEKLNLHSTMFLLIQINGFYGKYASKEFTFHYVSTYTLMKQFYTVTEYDLHSTMFLLIRRYQYPG